MDKSEGALKIIREALLRGKKPIVAFSGGKDSTVVLHLVRQVAPQTPALYNNTGVEFPETIQFCKTIPNLFETKPLKTFRQCVTEYGLPGNKSGKKRKPGNQCCYWLKDRPALTFYREHGYDLIFTGMTMEENRNRYLWLSKLGPTYFVKDDKYWKCSPIYDWSVADVWEYIHAKSLPYCKLYDEGVDRIGCGPCTAYPTWKRKLVKANPAYLRWILRTQKQSQLPEECVDGGA